MYRLIFIFLLASTQAFAGDGVGNISANVVSLASMVENAGGSVTTPSDGPYCVADGNNITCYY